MSELKEFDVGLGQYCEDGSPCVVAFDSDKNPRLLNEKVYLKSEADKLIAHQKYKRCFTMAKWCRFWENYWSCCKPNDIGAFIARERFFRKWKKRWMKIAKNFKELKNAED